eukprot:TRINITY_DN32489_c0_g1_i1.p1 TRINITY_DN32489_c0_g1~~TRINITY_DN32489_c0_g1_i1.p1  ORF type:complete len:592 (+),score=195.23 TRINITY_DN32489_c0_g1_i1:57-1778(+)
MASPQTQAPTHDWSAPLPTSPLPAAADTFLRNALVLAPEGGYRRSDITLSDGLITSVTPHRPGSEAPAGSAVVDCSERLVLPGFVNAHTHSTEHWVRGLIQPLPLELWVQQLMLHEPRGAQGWHGARSRELTPARALAVSALMCGTEALLSGCTAVLDHVHVRHVEDVAEVCAAYRALGIRAFVAPMLDDDTEMYTNYIPLVHDAADRNKAAGACGCGGMADGGKMRERGGGHNPEKTAANLKLWEEAARRFHDPAGGVNIVIGPVTVYSASEEMLRGAVDIRKRYNLPGHTHLLETRAQVMLARQLLPSGSAVRHLRDTGFLQLPGTSCAHCVWLDDDEMRIMAECGAVAVHNPLSNLRLGSGIAPLAKYDASGVTVALGCDGSASSDGQDMLEAMKLSTSLHTMTTPEYRDWKAPRESLRYASAGGYAAVGMRERGGEVAEGMVADLTLWDLTSLSMLPRTDPVNLLVLGSRCQARDAGSALASAYVRGVRVVEGGNPCGVDLLKLRSIVMAAQPSYRDPAATWPTTDPATAASEVEYRAAMGLSAGSVAAPAELTSFEQRRVAFPTPSSP